jgi:hypothetical protein
MFRKPLFWVVLAVVSAACAAYSAYMYPRAFPLINLELTMDREGALAEARTLADLNHWGPDGYRQAAHFSLDDEVQAFVELEGGGSEAFNRMMQDGSYAAYQWAVRHFRPGETHEVLIRFTPAGQPYGFREKIPEDEPGAALDAAAAREIAERSVTAPWRVDLSSFELVEQSQDVRPGGRVDHTLVYERSGLRVAGEGRFRLRLVVSGDRFTELTHFVKIPEAFTRRYEEMRSANTGIGSADAFALILLYGLGGIGFGLFMLLRKRAVLWKPALMWGLFVAFMQALVAVNHWPLLWMGYDTAVSAGNFAFEQVASIVGQFLGIAAMLTLSFMAAEGLTRLAFPRQVQLFKLWSKEVAPSRTVLGFTVGGFLAVAIFMAYDVSLYFFAHRWLGWWTPSSADLDPDILATYFPWLDSIAISLQAGFWEESLFRAVPIAGAALIGQRLGGRRWWIAAAFVVQALIFGGGHAPYPTQPAYARVVELIIPSIGFGLIYLRFGLLAGIILHYAFDVVWISLPLWASTAPGVWVDQTLVVSLCAVPLGIVLVARARRGAWIEVGAQYFNGAWTPPTTRDAAEPAVLPAASAGLGARTRAALLVLGVAGAIAWALASRFHAVTPPLQVSRADAESAAQEALATEHGFDPDPSWREMSVTSGGPGDADRFVWTEGGPEAYDRLLGAYLEAPAWWVRYARFEGDVAARAEEYQAWIGGTGEVVRIYHQLPEAAPGAKLDESEARTLARQSVEESYGLGETDVEEVAARPSSLPARTDWTFEFRDRAGYPLDQGEARIAVTISGDAVTDVQRYVHLPEDWERSERDRATVLRTISIVCGSGIALMLGAGAVTGIVRWSRRRFAVVAFLVAAGASLVISVVTFLNRWPVVEMNFSTSQSFPLQAGIVLGFGLVGVGFLAVGTGLNVGLVHAWLPPRPASRGAIDLAAGFALGLAAAGVLALSTALLPRLYPQWADYGAAPDFVPLLSAALEPLSSFILRTALALVMLTTVHRLTAGWTRRRALCSALLVVAGVLIAGVGADTLVGWIIAGLATGLVLWAAYALVLRHDLGLVPLVSAGLGIPGVLREGVLGDYPGALVGAVAASVLIIVAAVLWSRAQA